MKKHNFKSFLSVGILSLSLAGCVLWEAPAAKAAKAPAFVTKRSTLYENGSAEGTYTYTIKNLKKGYTVSWSKSGAGASYVSFQKKHTPVSQKKVSNQLTVDTLGSKNAKNKKVTITAKIYDKDKKLVKKLSDSVTLKVSSTSLHIKTSKITDDLTALSIGKSYDFDASVSPANATSRLYWSVTDEAGRDFSRQITSDGVWTPTMDGTYTIHAHTRNSANGRIISSAKTTAVVGSTLLSVRQTACDTIAVSFSSNMNTRLSLPDFALSYLGVSNSSTGFNSVGTTISLASLSLSEDGKTAYLKTHSQLTDQGVYQLSYKNTPVKTLTASIGVPVSGVITTTQIPANTYTDISFTLYDKNGVDVTSIYKYMASFDGVVPDGYLSSNGNLRMDTIGEYASVIMTCHTPEESFTINANILCVPEVSSGIRTVITSSSDNPVFDRSDMVSETSFYLGENAYFHFELYDENNATLAFQNPYFTSLDTEILTIAGDGRLTGKKAGTATLSIYCTVNGRQVNYRIPVTVLPRRTPSQLVLSTSNITLSNAREADYGAKIQVTAYDQYRNLINLDSAVAELTETNGKAVLASYDNQKGQITIRAQGAAPGSYTYTLSLLVGGRKISASFHITVQEVPATGIETYLAEAASITLNTDDLAADSAPLCFQLRLARYINGIFAGYATLQSASVQSELGWHSNDLTVKPSARVRKIYPEDNQIILTAGYWDHNTATPKAAPAGTYTVTLQYRDSKDVLQKTQNVVIVE